MKKKINYKKLIEKKQNITRDYDYHLFLLNEIKALNLVINEKEDLENEYNSLKNFEKIQFSFDELNKIINSENGNLIERLGSLLAIIKKISVFSSDYKNYDKRFEKVLLEFSDIIESMCSYSENLSFNPEKFNKIQSRLFKIQDLEKKHDVKSIRQLIDIKDDLESTIKNTDRIDKMIIEDAKEIKLLENNLIKMSEEIFNKRIQTSDRLQKEIKKIFSMLSLGESIIKFEFIKDGKLNFFGIDKLIVMYSPGSKIELKPLSKIASGGEKSRILLAIKSVFAKKNNLPTIIFDEIDSGTSGEIAESIGFLMKEISKKIQILSITHLAQVASKGDSHFKVIKTSNNGNSSTSIIKLSNNDRISEIASMISGKKITNSALNQAQELLK